MYRTTASLSPALITALSAGCAPMPGEPTANFAPLTEQAAFEAAIVGKRLTIEDTSSPSFLVVNAEGTMEGVYEGTAYAGTWQWRDGYFCRTGTFGFELPENCQLWEISGDRARSIRDRGQGSVSNYRL
ncbi:hypothetical protein ACR03S_12605 [Limimaricola variabilis]